MWSDRFELGVDELHRVDEVVTAQIVGRIDPVILFIEGQPKRREKVGATGLLLRAMPHDLQHGAREVREGRRADRAGARHRARTMRWCSPGRPTGSCCMSARAGPRIRRASSRSCGELCLQRDQDRSGQCRGARDLRARLRIREAGFRRRAALFRPRAAAQSEPRLHLGVERRRPTATSASRTRRSSGWSATASSRRSIRISASSRTSTARPICFNGDYEQAADRRPPRGQGQSAVHQRLQAADRRARPSRTARGGAPYVDKLLDARAEFHRRSSSRRSIRSRRRSTAIAICEGLRLAGVPEG